MLIKINDYDSVLVNLRILMLKMLIKNNTNIIIYNYIDETNYLLYLKLINKILI